LNRESLPSFDYIGELLQRLVKQRDRRRVRLRAGRGAELARLQRLTPYCRSIEPGRLR